MNELFVNKSVFNSYDADKLEQYKIDLFNHYRLHGFPYFNLTESELDKEFNKLKNCKSESLLNGTTVKQIMLGLNVVNYFMPHMFHVRSHNFQSPYDAFISDDMLKKAITKRLLYGDNMSDAGMRKVLSWVSGTQKVSNFRPTVAKLIYDMFSGDGSVLDYSSGFGGRLLGAMSSDKIKSYTGFDPNTTTYKALCNIRDTIKHDKEIVLYNEPFEDSDLINNSFDLSFSSPPYYNTEEYCYEDTQSFIRYTTKEAWRDNFLKVLIQKNYNCIKPNGYFVINIANVKTYKDLEKDTVDIAKSIGFEYIETYQMALSSLMKSGFKYEPIFIFRKP